MLSLLQSQRWRDFNFSNIVEIFLLEVMMFLEDANGKESRSICNTQIFE